MVNSTVVCPKCQVALKANKPIRPGKKLTCPKCQTPFVAPAPEEFTEAETITLKAPLEILNLKIPDRDDDDGSPAKSGPDSEISTEPSTTNNTLLILLVIGAGILFMVFLAIAVGVVWWYLSPQ